LGVLCCLCPLLALVCCIVRRKRRNNSNAVEARGGTPMQERGSATERMSVSDVHSTRDLDNVSAPYSTEQPAHSPRATLKPDIDSEYETDSESSGSAGQYHPLPSPRKDNRLDVTALIDDDRDDWHIDRMCDNR
jgi:hypothetical protein